jgi:hypothetical protein
LVRKPCFSVVQSNDRYKKNPKRDREIMRDGSTNSMTPADGGGDKGGVVEGGVDEVGVETGANMGAGAGADVVISS